MKKMIQAQEIKNQERMITRGKHIQRENIERVDQPVLSKQ